MSFLRSWPTQRLLALCGAVAALVAVGAAIAVAASGGGTPPPRQPLATAIRGALTAKPVQGVSADVTFTNRLIDGSSLQGADPILKGAKGRVWADAQGRLRVELQADGGNGDAQLVSDGRTATLYDPGMDTVYRATLPRERAKHDAAQERVPTVAEIQRRLAEARKGLRITGPQPGTNGDRGTYTVQVGPRHDGGLLGGAQLAWDAATGTPLRAAVYAAGDAQPVLELAASNVKFGRVPASTFAVHPPAGAKVVDLTPKGGAAAAPRHAERGAKARRHHEVAGVRAVRARLPFALTAPRTLAGLPRGEARLIATDGKPAALVTYGQGLGGIAVLESAADASGAAGAPAAPRREGEAQLSLPKVDIGGATGEELDTALGSVIRFQRGGVQYVVAGSVPPTAAVAAAKGL